jgi:hypothetical protein
MTKRIIDKNPPRTSRAVRFHNSPLQNLQSRWKKKAPTWDRLPIEPLAGEIGFLLRCEGDCLAPRLPDSCILTLEPELPQPGELGVFWFKGQPKPVVKIALHEIFGYPLSPESSLVPIVRFRQINPPRTYQVYLDQIECIARVHRVFDHRCKLLETRPIFSAASQRPLRAPLAS